MDSKITDSGGAHSLLGGISIAQTNGGDYFLHFQSYCRDKYETAKDPYKFIPDSDIIQQSRADICMLRYNTSTVLKLNAMSRHVEPPGAVIFISDNIPLQLNQSDKSSASSNSNIKQPLKHPKMRIKLPQNRYQQQPPIEVNKKQSNANEQSIKHQEEEQQQQLKQIDVPKEVGMGEMAQIVSGQSEKQKAIKLREKQLSQDLAAHRLKLKQKGSSIANEFDDGENPSNFNDIMNKISMMNLPREYKEDIMVNFDSFFWILKKY